MKKILTLIISVACLSAFPIDEQAINSISKQYRNRGWNYHSQIYGIRTHLANYGSQEYLLRAIQNTEGYYSNLFSLSEDMMAMFYPEAKVVTSTDLILEKKRIEELINNYQVVMNWEELLAVLNENHWEDVDTGNCPIESPVYGVGSENCGRKRKANYLVANMTYEQRQNLNAFKEMVFSEIELVGGAEFGDFPVGPGAARIFQVIYDDRVIHALLNEKYLGINNSEDVNLRKKNIVAILRAIIIQMFVDQNGELVDSNLQKIRLENTDCFNKTSEDLIWDCHLAYTRRLFADIGNLYNQTQINLIFDMKNRSAIVRTLNRVLADEEITDEKLLKVIKKYYFALSYAYDFEPSGEGVDSAFISSLRNYLIKLSEKFLNDGSFISLKVGRGIHSLVSFLGSY